ncbi:LytR C-terminal domain-containing protein [Actinomyces trachealis]|uniref:LytR C-terminal domain-containing protein n=1 Tax=Actinomyces trachealis TaxID=2763540 RepID=UPI0018C6B94E|nr:LytR C-terminal domain-containing protein [Actinomyces trachealis]
MTSDPRTAYRRRLQHRQTTVVGTVLVAMTAIVIGGLMVWTGMVPPPYEPGFSTPAPNTEAMVRTCPADGAVTSMIAQIQTNVYNGTNQAGLAGGVADRFRDAGMSVANTADWPHGDFNGDVLITAGVDGLSNAYTIAKAFDTDVYVKVDPTVAAGDVTVNVVLGKNYMQSVKAKEAIAAIPPGEAIEAPADCKPAVATATPTT